MTIRSSAVLRLVVTIGSLSSASIHAQAADTVQAGKQKLSFAPKTGMFADEAFLVNNGVTAPGPRSTKEVRETACASNNRCYLVVMIGQTPRGNMVDSVWADRTSFALVRHVEVGFGNRTEVNVVDGRIKGTAADSGKPVREINEAGPAFDFSVIEEIVPSLPLKVGYVATLRTFDVTQGFRAVGVSVTGEETLDTKSGKRDAWVVEFSFGTHKAKRWFDKKTGAGLKWLVDMGNGRSMWGQATER